MEKTSDALASLREHWISEGCPNISDIARRANVARGTAHRYLTNVTKGGTAEIIRALANAMGRTDIADSVPYTGIDHVQHKEDYIAELALQWQEKSQQLLADASAKHRQEMDDLIRHHSLEREDWNVQRKAMYDENANLRASFDKAVNFRDAQLRAQRIEKVVLFVLLTASVLALIIR